MGTYIAIFLCGVFTGCLIMSILAVAKHNDMENDDD